MVLCGTTLGLSPVLPTSQINAHSDLALPTVLLFRLSSYRLSAANRFWWLPLKVWHAQRGLSIIRRLTAAPTKNCSRFQRSFRSQNLREPLGRTDYLGHNENYLMADPQDTPQFLQPCRISIDTQTNRTAAPHTAFEYRRSDAAVSCTSSSFLWPRLATAAFHLSTVIHMSVILSNHIVESI